MKSKSLVLLGIRGIPAAHGGFETFAEQLCLFLVNKGWNVTVYCQEAGKGNSYESYWEGVKRIHIPVSEEGPLGTVIFDLKSVWLSRKYCGVHLTLGYNTALFNVVQRFFGIKNIINMDGIEWRRQKWGVIARAWFWLNERFGCWLGNHLVADHPRIEDHLATRVSRNKITMIPYGGIEVIEADISVVYGHGVSPGEYSIVIARPEPENSILEIVQAFCTKSRRGKLIVLGEFTPELNMYHQQIIDAANNSVIFLGAIYDAAAVDALRFYSRCYVHGHQVGGTNPALVEALGAGCAVIAHDNHFNRWVAGDGAFYFSDVDHLARFFDDQYMSDDYLLNKKSESRSQFQRRFKWEGILLDYENLLSRFL